MYCFEIHVFLVASPKNKEQTKTHKPKKSFYTSSPSAFPCCGHLLIGNEIYRSLFPEIPSCFSLLLTTTAQKSAALKQNFLQCVMLLLKFNDIPGWEKRAAALQVVFHKCSPEPSRKLYKFNSMKQIQSFAPL